MGLQKFALFFLCRPVAHTVGVQGAIENEAVADLPIFIGRTVQALMAYGLHRRGTRCRGAVSCAVGVEGAFRHVTGVNLLG